MNFYLQVYIAVSKTSMILWYLKVFAFPCKNAIAFNKMIFNTIKFFEEYLIYGIKDKNKETWAFKLTYSLMIFNANAILHLQHT